MINNVSVNMDASAGMLEVGQKLNYWTDVECSSRGGITYFPSYTCINICGKQITPSNKRNDDLLVAE